MTRTRLEHVDALRGLAAALVLCSHVRNYVFADYGALSTAGLLTRAFYAATSLGHASVVVFFAVSGYLVGGKALHDLLTERWSWPHYLLRRSTRLLIVAGPALVLTWLLDHAGMTLSGSGYAGAAVERYASWPVHHGALDYSLGTFLGNLAFLQTIDVPVFGTNGPAWSLANEFWYYLVFPLAAFIVLAGRARLVRRVLALCLLLACLTLLPWALLLGGAIWVAGAGTAWLAGRACLAPVLRHPALRVAALALTMAGLGVTRTLPESLAGDLVFGLAVALVLPVVVLLPSFGRLYKASAQVAAEMSYTLYLTHFPFVTLLVMVGLAPDRFQPGVAGALVYAGLLVAAVAWARLVWWCFERRTDRVFRRLSTRLIARPGHARPGEPAVVRLTGNAL